MFEGEGLVVGGGDTAATVTHLDALAAILLETNLDGNQRVHIVPVRSDGYVVRVVLCVLAWERLLGGDDLSPQVEWLQRQVHSQPIL